MKCERAQLVRTVEKLRHIVFAWKSAGERIVVVPTMGALHSAHLALVRDARLRAERSIVTIFVNPAQFNDAADLANYPRDETSDMALLNGEGVDLVFVPSPHEMYPDGFATKVSIAGVSEGLCGSFRPGHFDGVATVVAKIFNLTQADFAVFGEKDYQQLHVVRRMARDLDLSVEIIAHPTVREIDGLAMSSRNRRLTHMEKQVAPVLSQTLLQAAIQLRIGQPADHVLRVARTALIDAGFSSVEYLELRSERDLRPLQTLTERARLLAAVALGRIRLIDNVPVSL